MERKVESGIRCINQADKLLSIFRKKYIELQEDKKDMSLEELKDNERLLGSQFGLICEYYLKGLWLPCVRLTVPSDAPELQVIIDNITPDQEYKLLIWDTTVIQELHSIYGIPDKKIKKLIEQSLRKVGGNGHDLSYFIGTQFLTENNREIKLPIEVRKEIYKGMESYFLDRFTPKSHEEWKNFLKDFYVIDDDSSERTNTHEGKFDDTIADKSISNAFFSGRYGHLENYVPNLDALYHLAYSIRDSIKKQYPNAISITDGIFDGYNNSSGVRYIFPDENSKIYVFDDKNKLTRVYTLENANDFILKQYGLSIDDGKHEDAKELSICPEYGIGTIREISEYKPNKEGTPDASMSPTSLLRVKKDAESIIICQIDGEQKGYIYRNGRIIDTSEERVQEYSQLIDEYETEREKGLYDEETQEIRKSFFNQKVHEKDKIEHDDNTENWLGTKKHSKRIIRLAKRASLLAKGSRVFKGNIFGKKLSNKSKMFLEEIEEEIMQQKFLEKETDKISKAFNENDTEMKEADKEAKKRAEQYVINQLLQYAKNGTEKKRSTHEELEDKLDEEELIEAYEDKHGIGKELLSKIKKLFMGKGEK